MAMAMNGYETHNGRYRDPDATEDAKTYSMFMHIVSALFVIDISGVLLLIATLVMWLLRRKGSSFIDDHGREVVNFQISLYILAIAGVIALVVFSVVTLGVGAVIAAPLGIAGVVFLWILRLIGTIRGAIAAYKGEIYRYPMSIRVIPEPAH
ncbi:MAG: DUF4870 domain-containing protein [Phycisphaerales bacterium]